MHVFLRIEFQDGTRKAPTQDYHGSGRPHVHVLVFAPKEALRSMKLEESVFATLPEPLDENDPLPGIVEGSQLDRAGRSGWPLHMESSQWDSATDTLLLHRNRDNKAKGLRPYFLPVMEALRCHQDLQVADDDGVLRSYVAKYVSKFSDSSQDEWLNDSAQGNAIAATVLCRYRPCEPELASGNGLSAPRAVASETSRCRGPTSLGSRRRSSNTCPRLRPPATSPCWTFFARRTAVGKLRHGSRSFTPPAAAQRPWSPSPPTSWCMGSRSWLQTP